MEEIKQPVQRQRNWRTIGAIVGLLAAIAFTAVYILDRAGMFTVVEVEVLRSSPQAVLGLTIDKNMIVVDVDKSGSAADAGIQSGDVLVATIDQRVKSLEELNTAIQAIRGQRPNIIAMPKPTSVDPQEQAKADATQAAEIAKQPALTSPKVIALTVRQ
jgi:predicted metalloprotease with PDZ domain